MKLSKLFTVSALALFLPLSGQVMASDEAIEIMEFVSSDYESVAVGSPLPKVNIAMLEMGGVAQEPALSGDILAIMEFASADYDSDPVGAHQPRVDIASMEVMGHRSGGTVLEGEALELTDFLSVDY
jgi:hypothetical protein